jgi:trk system potassium uptake protein TrkH
MLRFAGELLYRRIPGGTVALVHRVSALALRIAGILIPLLLTLSAGLIIYAVGFEDLNHTHRWIYNTHRAVLFLLCILMTVRFVITFPTTARWRARIFNFLLVILVFYLRNLSEAIPLLDAGSASMITQKLIFFAGLITLFFTEVSHILRFIYQQGVNPALLFVASFAGIIVIGGFLLLLPNATEGSIAPIDAFFTSASAVCVTGLMTIDHVTTFTMTGKVIILFLIQLGGLGIMTFAGLIAFMVTGSVSIQSQLALRDMFSSGRISNAISFLTRVILVTLTFEAIGAFLIYGVLPAEMFRSEGDRIFFAVFHAVSSFCNAGISTLHDGLHHDQLRFNYGLHWIVGLLVILGGMGFPVVFNIFTFVRIRVTNFIRKVLKDPATELYTNILHTSSRLALITYFVLLVAGFVCFLILEYNHSLREHTSVLGKLTTSFFAGSVAPRTSGFNTFDVTALSLPTVMIFLLLMYIGASPGSTGGGIKTTVAAVAFLNMRSIVLGHDRTEAFRSEISGASIKRAFAIILLSLVVLGLSVLLLSLYDAEHGLFQLSFEVFSAFSTTGLSLGITPKLSTFGKLVIMATLFIGRIGALTLLFAVVTRKKPRSYRYPAENIMF